MPHPLGIIARVRQDGEATTAKMISTRAGTNRVGMEENVSRPWEDSPVDVPLDTPAIPVNRISTPAPVTHVETEASADPRPMAIIAPVPPATREPTVKPQPRILVSQTPAKTGESAVSHWRVITVRVRQALMAKTVRTISTHVEIIPAAMEDDV